MRLTPTLSSLALLVVLGGVASAGTTLDREFSFAPDQIQLRPIGDVTQVDVRGATPSFDAGLPELPWLPQRVELPAGMRIESVEVLEQSTEPITRGVRLPSGWTMAADGSRQERSRPNLQAFTRRGFQPLQSVRLGYQGWERGQSIGTFSVCPVRWEATTGQLERVSHLKVRLTLAPALSQPLPRLRLVPEWEPAVSRGPVRDGITPLGFGGNRTAGTLAATQIPSLLGSPVEYVIITNDEMAPEFQRLADWKTQSGVPAVVRTLSFIRSQYVRGSDDAERVRDFIRDAYSRWGTKWVLLGGDTDVVPERLARNLYFSTDDIASDLYFSCLDGNWDADGDHQYGEGYLNVSSPGDSADLLPEVYVGRAPTVTLSEAQKFVDRTLAYEKTPVGDYERGILIAAEVLFPEDWHEGEGVLLDGGSMGDELLPAISQNPSMRPVRLYQNYTYPGWVPGVLPETKQAVVDSLNRGYGITVHIGHGYRNVMSLATGNIFIPDVMALTNNPRLTNLYAINCTSNAIDYPCIGEAFMHAANGGAVTNIGSTRLDFPYAGRLFEKEYFRLVMDDSTTAIGEAQAKQKLPQVVNAEQDNAVRWMQQSLLLLGDPELRIWTGTPRTLNVTVAGPGTFALSDTAISVTVTISGSPLAGARVTAYKAGDAYQSGLTNGSGFVKLPFRIDALGTITLTVTGYDCRPSQTAITVTASAAAVLGDGAPITIDDDAVSGTSGDSDAIFDAGEIIDLRIPVLNSGGASATGVNATLSTTDPNVSITVPSVAYGTVGPGATVTPVGAFRMSLSALVRDQREIPFTFTITDAAAHVRVRNVYLTIRAPDLRHFAHDVNDNGDHDGQPDVGEIVTYLPHLKNMGTADARSVTAVLRNYDGAATISDSTSSWGDVAAGQEKVGDGFTFTPTFITAKVELRVSDSHGLRFTRLLDIVSPGVPLNVTGVGQPTSIKVIWDPRPESDLLGYNVYRSSAPGGPFTRSNSVPTDKISTYEDGPLTPLTKYYFYATAVDTCGNESLKSSTVPISTNPPTHGLFPLPMNAAVGSPVAVDHLYPGFPLDIAAGSDVLYCWHHDGTAPVDADGSGATNGDMTERGKTFYSGASIADLDGDGAKEVIGTASDSGQVVVVQQSGATMPGWPAVFGGASFSGVAVGDLLNDGKKEVVLSSYTYGRLLVFKYNGTELMDGDFNAGTNGVFKVLGAPYNPGTPAIADLDGNGQRDIIYGSFDGKLYAWRPNGTNLPGFPVTLPEPITGSVAIGYLDGPGDAQLDIVVNTGYSTNANPAKDSVYVFNAVGARRAGFPKQLNTSASAKSPSPALADMNNDGFLDIVTASTDGKIYVYDRTGAQLGAWSGGRAYSTATQYASEASPTVADIDGDGLADVAMGDENGSLTVLSGVNGLPLPGFPIQLGSNIAASPALCDCDGDGKTEIVLAGMDRDVMVWDYDFPFSPGVKPPWPQFHHDAMRTGLYSNPSFVAVDPSVGPPLASATIELAVPSPNPTRNQTLFSYVIPSAAAGAKVELAIYDLAGRQVRVIETGMATPGRYKSEWNLGDATGRRVDPGLYFARLTLGADSRSQKVIVVQ